MSIVRSGMMRPRSIVRCRVCGDFIVMNQGLLNSNSMVRYWHFMGNRGVMDRHGMSGLMVSDSRSGMVNGLHLSVVGYRLRFGVVNSLGLGSVMISGNLSFMGSDLGISVMGRGKLVLNTVTAVIDIECILHEFVKEGLRHLDVLDSVLDLNLSNMRLLGHVMLLADGHVAHLRLVVLAVLGHINVTRPRLLHVVLLHVHVPGLFDHHVAWLGRIILGLVHILRVSLSHVVSVVTGGVGIVSADFSRSECGNNE